MLPLLRRLPAAARRTRPSAAAAVGMGLSNNATPPTVVEKKNRPNKQRSDDDPPSKLTRPKNNNLNQIFFLMDDDEDEEEDDKNEEVVESTTTTTTATSGTTSTTSTTPTPTVEQGTPPSEAGISPHHGLASATDLPPPPLLTPLLLTRDHDHPQDGQAESSEFAASAQAETLRLPEDTTTATRALQEMVITSTSTTSSSHHYSEAGFVRTPGLVPYHHQQQHQQQRPLSPSEADSISHVLASATDLPPLQLTRDHPQDEPAESSEFAAAAQAETLRLQEGLAGISTRLGLALPPPPLTCDHPQDEPAESSEFAAAAQAETLRLQEDTTMATSALQKMVITSTISSSDADFVHSPGLVRYHQHQQQYHQQHQRPLPLQRLRLGGDSGNCYSGDDLWDNELASSYFSTVPPWAVFFGSISNEDGFGFDGAAARDEMPTVASTGFATTITAGMTESKMDYAKVARTIASNPTSGEDEEQAAPALELLNNSTSFHRAVQLYSPDECQSAIEHITEQEAQDQEGYRDLAERAEAILRGMLNKKGLVGDPHRHVEPNEGCYFSVMKAYKKARLPERAEAILRLMFEDWGSGNLTAEPTARCFSQVLRAWLKSKCSTAPQHCERILREMYKLSDTQRLPLCKPNVHSVAVVLNCWTESGEHESATRAAIIFRQMKTRFLNGDDDLRPENFCYSFILNAFVDESKIEAAEDLLWEMVDDFLDGNDRAKPRIRDLNTILAMYACSGTEDAAARAECVVSRFRELHDTGALRLSPDGYTILWLSRLLKTWMATTTTTAGSHSNKVNKSGREKKPPAVCLEWLRNLGKSVRTSTSLYTSVIESLVNRGDRDGAHGILELMIDECGVVAANKNKIQRIHPDHKIFDLVIAAYAGGFLCKGRPDARTGESILRQMWYLSEQKSSSNHNLRPRLSTYEILINANAKGNNAKRADDLLWEMVEKKIGYPSQELLETVAKAWKTSRHPDQQRQLNKVNCFKKKLYGKKTSSSSSSSSRASVEAAVPVLPSLLSH